MIFKRIADGANDSIFLLAISHNIVNDNIDWFNMPIPFPFDDEKSLRKATMNGDICTIKFLGKKD